MDSAVGDEADGASLGDFLGETERGYERVEDRAWLEWVFSHVTPTGTGGCWSCATSIVWDSGRPRRIWV